MDIESEPILFPSDMLFTSTSSRDSVYTNDSPPFERETWPLSVWRGRETQVLEPQRSEEVRLVEVETQSIPMIGGDENLYMDDTCFWFTDMSQDSLKNTSTKNRDCIFNILNGNCLLNPINLSYEMKTRNKLTVNDASMCINMIEGRLIEQNIKILSYSKKCIKKLNKLNRISIFNSRVYKPVPIDRKFSLIVNYYMYGNCLSGSFILKNPLVCHLKYLNISQNNLECLCLENIDCLREVEAKSNLIKYINIKNNKQLQKLDLENNLIVNIDKSLSSNISLFSLNLSNNKINIFDCDILPKSIKVLKLDYNRILSLDITMCKNLHTLSISNNHLCLFLIENKELVNLNVQHNILSNINPQKMFTENPNLSRLNMEDNPFIEYTTHEHGKECTICLEMASLMRVYRYCLHEFCYNCSFKFIKCPYCRAPIYDKSNFSRNQREETHRYSNNTNYPFQRNADLEFVDGEASNDLDESFEFRW